MWYKKLSNLLIAFISFFAFSSMTTVLAVDNPSKLFSVYNNFPDRMISLGDTDYYVAYSNDYGQELFKIEGSESGFSILKNIAEGDYNSFIYRIYKLNNELYFFAETNENGYELWKSDGTTDGTILLKDINEGWDSSKDYDATMLLYNDELYFFANDGIHGMELWKSDGTSSGTQMIADISPGDADTNPVSVASDELFGLNGKIYFVIHNIEEEVELWESDGTEAGTKFVSELPEELVPANSGISYQVFNDKLYFILNDGGWGTDLWETDGTAEGTKPVQYDIDNGLIAHSTFLVYNDKLYFTAYDNENWFELYSLNSSDVVTRVTGDIFDDIEEVYSGVVYDDFLYFTDSYGVLYRTNGSTAEVVKNLSSEVSETYLSGFEIYNNKLYFLRCIYEQEGERNIYVELWESDGTTDGTKLIDYHLPYGEGPFPYFVTDNGIYYGKAFGYFESEMGRYWDSEVELWKYTSSADVTEYTVIFKDYNGNTIKTETVAEGSSATAPTSPIRSGYTFKGWDKAYNNVTSNLTVTATYTKNVVTTSNPVIEEEEPVLEINSITTDLTETEVENYNFIIQEKANGKTLVDVYDINLLLKGQKVQPDGSLEIRILMTEKQKNYENLEVLYIDDNNNVITMPHTIEGDYIVFTVNHLSKYVLVGDVKEEETPVVDDLDDKNAEEKGMSPIIYVGVGALTLIVIIVILARKKKDK